MEEKGRRRLLAEGAKMNPVKNHRVVVSKRGAPDVLQIIEEDLPEPAPNEVRIKVLAAGVSAYDVMLRSRSFPGFPKVPYSPGEDVVGVVDEIGGEVTTLAVGDMVATWTFGAAGGYTEYLCWPVHQVVPVPADLDPAAAVAVIVNYLTANLAIHECARAKSGERVLVHGAAGGVGSALVQLGGLAGLEMYGTASKHNHELVTEMGATPIDYRNEDFVKRIRELTGDGVDIVFDLIGGARQLWRSYRTLRAGGRLVMLGMAGTHESGTRIIPPSLLMVGALKLLPGTKKLPMSPGMQKYPQEHNDWYRETLMEMFDLAATGKLEPLIAERIPLAEAWRAHEVLERGGHAGKVVLVPVA
jgi:NADPH:quinone reductase-like Zn-dependent oxidoreductase